MLCMNLNSNSMLNRLESTKKKKPQQLVKWCNSKARQRTNTRKYWAKWRLKLLTTKESIKQSITNASKWKKKSNKWTSLLISCRKPTLTCLKHLPKNLPKPNNSTSTKSPNMKNKFNTCKGNWQGRKVSTKSLRPSFPPANFKHLSWACSCKKNWLSRYLNTRKKKLSTNRKSPSWKWSLNSWRKPTPIMSTSTKAG